MEKITQELLAEAKESLLFTAVRPEVVMEKGKGMYLWDTDGNKYLDFIGGWASNSLGHSPEVVARTLEQQGAKLVNASPSFYNKPMIEFAKLLTDHSCMDRVFFTSTGAEANEGAVKLARKYGDKHLNGAYEIVTTINGFHGRTLAMMSATGKKQWEHLYAPKVPGFIHVPLNDMEAMVAAVNPNTCAIMLEPIQGESGVNVAEDAYMKALRKLCDEKGILLILDEVQTGMGRTGTLFAYEQYGIEPDIMTLGKGIGGGFPLSALLAKEKYNIFEPGDQGGSYTGQPLAMAVGFAVVSEVINANLKQNAELEGKYIKEQLAGLQEKFGIENIRGKGLLLAFDLPKPVGSEVASECLKDGLLINSPKPTAIRLMPPLIVTKEEIDSMFTILSGVLARVLQIEG